MEIKSPQRDYFKIAGRYTRIYDVFFWIVFIFTVIFTFFDFSVVVDCIGIFALVTLLILEYIMNYYIFKAEETRRRDYFDNSFGTHYGDDPSQNYYDTDEINYGVYKMIVNTFESALFSLEISKRMENRILIKNLLFLVIIIGLAIYGFIQTTFSIPILQLFLSRSFIIELLDIHKYNTRVERVFSDLKKLFTYSLVNTSESIEKNMAEIIKLYIEYESNISDLKIMLDSKKYSSVNEELTEKWNAMKETYNIS